MYRRPPIHTLSPYPSLSRSAEAPRHVLPRLPGASRRDRYAGPGERRLPSLVDMRRKEGARDRSEEHTSELQSRQYLVCRLLLEKKKCRTSSILFYPSL